MITKSSVHFYAYCFNVFVIIFTKFLAYRRLQQFRLSSHNLKTLILNIIVLLWVPNQLTNFTNFSLPVNFLKTLSWWYAIIIIPFFSILMMYLYFWITIASSSQSWIISVSLFNSSDSTASFMMIDSNNCFLIFSCDNRFVFLLSAAPLYICKRKITTILQI